MFKKQFSTSIGHKLSGADRKKLRRNLQSKYRALSDEALDLILPVKTGDVLTAKLSQPHRGTVYFLNNAPILIDTSGKGDFVPTVFALWEIPSFLPRIFVKHFAVSKFILGGADLMLPGVHVPENGFEDSFLRGTLVSVSVMGNPAPIAVGTTTTTSRDARQGGKGKLVEVLHHFGDLLWESHPEHPIPNQGFTTEMVLPIQEQPTADNNENIDESDLVDDLDDLDLEEGEASCSGRVEDGQGGGLGADMDGLLEVCLFQSLHKSLKDKELPVQGSAFWKNHMVPNRYPGSEIDYKKSSFKKLTKFLQAYGPNGSRVQGLLGLSEDKYSSEMSITSVNRCHDMYTGFKPYKLSDPSESGGGQSEVSLGVVQPVEGLLVEELFKSGKELSPILEALGLHTGALYTAKEVGEIGFQYVDHAGLDKGVPDRQHIVLDATLSTALYKGLIKKGAIYPSHLKKSDLRDMVMRRMQPQFRITRDDQQIVKRGSLPPVQISEEKRQGNKKVTRTAGIELFLMDPKDFSSACQKKFACSTSVYDLPGKNVKGKEIVMQGHVADQLAVYLIEQYQIPKKYIEAKKMQRKKK